MSKSNTALTILPITDIDLHWLSFYLELHLSHPATATMTQAVGRTNSFMNTMKLTQLKLGLSMDEGGDGELVLREIRGQSEVFSIQMTHALF